MPRRRKGFGGTTRPVCLGPSSPPPLELIGSEAKEPSLVLKGASNDRNSDMIFTRVQAGCQRFYLGHLVSRTKNTSRKSWDLSGVKFVSKAAVVIRHRECRVRESHTAKPVFARTLFPSILRTGRRSLALRAALMSSRSSRRSGRRSSRLPARAALRRRCTRPA
jgi:hypothetical protein